MADARRRTIKAVYENPHRLRQHRADAASPATPAFPETKLRRSGRPPGKRGYNSFVPLELQVDLADMKAFGGKPCPDMLAAVDLAKKVDAEPLKDRLATTTAVGVKKVFQTLRAPANVYSDDGSEFKRGLRMEVLWEPGNFQDDGAKRDRPGAVDGGGGAGRHRQHDHLPEALSGRRPHRA